MLFVLTLGIILGIAGITLLHQWLTGALAPAEERPVLELEPVAFPRLAPPEHPMLAQRTRRAA